MKNFLTTLRRMRLSSALNIFGLSVAFAAFMVMMMQVRFEWGYGKTDPNHKEIFRVETPSVFEKGKWSRQVDGQSIGHLAQSEPRVKGCYYSDGASDVDVFLGSDSTNIIKIGFYEDYTNPTEFFSFDIVQGTADALTTEPGKVIIPQSLAKQLFADRGAVGEVLQVRGKYFRSSREQIIIGVYRDFADNATLRNKIFGGPSPTRKNSKTGEIFDAGVVYIRAAVEDTAQIIENLYQYDIANDKYGFGKSRSRLTAVGETYYADDVSIYNDTPPGNRSTTMLLFSISLLVIVIAGINFINFSTAMAPLRIRGLNTRLVFGKPKSSLRAMLIVEAIGISAIAYMVSILWVSLFDLSSVSELIRTDSTALADNLPVVLGTALVALVTGALAGIYPAFYCTRFSAALVLKGSGMGSTSGQWLRSALIGFQYIVSLILITVALFIALQNSYMQNFPLGFNRENVFTLSLSVSSANDRKLFTDKLKQNPAIEDVTFSWGRLGEGYGMMSSILVGGEKVNIGAMPVQHNFMNFFSIPIVEGRGFTEGDLIDKYPDRRGFTFDSDPALTKMIYNRKAQQMYDIKLDSIYGNDICIGICDNINSRSLYNDYEPMGFALSTWIGQAYVRTSGSNIDEIYKYIEKCYDELNMEEDFDCKLLNDVLQQQYLTEQNLSRLINLFTALAIMLSLVGVFGLVVFENQYRRREIGLRKIYGSTVMQVLLRFNRKFLFIISICFIIALPIAWWATSEWLMTFTFRTQLHWWVFASALIIVGLITVLTVTLQSWHSATENPVNSLKSE